MTRIAIMLEDKLAQWQLGKLLRKNIVTVSFLQNWVTGYICLQNHRNLINKSYKFKFIYKLYYLLAAQNFSDIMGEVY